MIVDTIEIRPIKLDEWLPDRCLNGATAFDPNSNLPETGCPSLNYFKRNNRKTLEQMYEMTINTYGGCGFVAWDKGKIIAYHNFFPQDIASQIKFYGHGFAFEQPNKTLIHNCLTIAKDYLRKGISSRLVKASIDWARTNNWKRFEVHFVLPDCEKGWQYDQKSCISFWEKHGFKIFKKYDADLETRKYYGVIKRYSAYIQLDN